MHYGFILIMVLNHGISWHNGRGHCVLLLGVLANVHCELETKLVIFLITGKCQKNSIHKHVLSLFITILIFVMVYNQQCGS